MNTKKIMLSGLILGTASFAQAGTITNAGVTILGVGCGASGTCFANTKTAVGPTALCTGSKQLRWDGSNSQGKNFTAILMSAKIAGETVNIGTFDDACSGTNPSLNFVTVQ